MKKISLMTILVILLFNAITVGAVEKKDYQDHLEGLYFIEENVENKIINEYFDDLESTKRKMKLMNYTLVNEERIHIVKMYTLTENDYVNGYLNSGDINAFIQANYEYIIPLKDSEGNVRYRLKYKKGDGDYSTVDIDAIKDYESVIESIKSKEGKWYSYMLDGINNTLGKLIYDDDRINDYLQSLGLSNISEIKMIQLPGLYTIIYVKSNNKEYGIPFDANKELSKLTSGELYDLNNLFITLKDDDRYKAFVQYLTNPDNKSDVVFGNGTLTLSEENQGSSIIVYIIIALLLVITSAFIIYKKKIVRE